MVPSAVFLVAGLLVAALIRPAVAAGFDQFRDPDDGQIDLSGWLIERKGFLPVPIVITEPAVGYGGGLGALFVRNSMRETAVPGQATGRTTPPDLYAIGAAGTQNGTWAGFGGGMVSFDDDRWRWRGGLVRTSANLDFYGLGGRSRPVRYNLDGWASVQQGMRRLGQSDAWLVARWNLLDLSNRFDAEGQATTFGPLVRTHRASGLGLSLESDTRDNIFTPSRGWTGSIDATWYSPDWGSNTHFQSYRGHVFGWWPATKALVLGGRIDGRAVDGQVPFYMLPFVDLRGVPAFRLQDRRTAVVETEARWNLTARWALIGFVGTGRAWGTTTAWRDGTQTVSKGVGFRYLVARRLGLYTGIDWARSSQDQAFYIQVGSAWR